MSTPTAMRDSLEILNGNNAVATALSAGAALSKPITVGDGLGIVVPEGYALHDLEKQLPTPTRKRGAFKLRDAASFIAYFKKHQLASTLYGRIDPPRFLAVFDDHRKDEAGWRDHIASYDCPLSPEWKTWLTANKKPFKQAEFAQFIEDNLPDIVEPAGADMLEISRTLEAKKKINFASGIRLSNGQQELTYEEQIEGTASKGKLQIPEMFVLGIPVLEGGPRYKVQARLRYRIDGGTLAMWFDLLRPHKISEDAVLAVWKEISDGTATQILNGDPDLSA